MIKTIHELLSAIREKGIDEIEPFLKIGHNPTIGDMYEGLTKELMNKVIFSGINLQVKSGKIQNEKGELSKQIDCMIVIGEGAVIPFTTDYVYKSKDVVAVIEVKKNLFSKDLDSAYYNLKSVQDIAQIDKSMEMSLVRSAFKLIAKTELPEPDEISTLSFEKQMIYHALIMECYLPTRIVFGYSGFKSEHSLREKFVQYIKEQSVCGKKKGKGFGAVSLPSLIICGESSLIKTNGLPYAIGMNTDDWVLYASYSKTPLLLLLEIIWTRLTFLFPINSNELFQEDLTIEMLKPLLVAKANENMWEYQVIDLKEKELIRLPDEWEWQPTFLTKVEFCIMNKLCEGCEININDNDLLKFISQNDEDIDIIIRKLTEERLVYLDGEKIRLLTDECQCVITPGGFVAAENKDGKLTTWMLNKK